MCSAPAHLSAVDPVSNFSDPWLECRFAQITRRKHWHAAECTKNVSSVGDPLTTGFHRCGVLCPDPLGSAAKLELLLVVKRIA